MKKFYFIELLRFFTALSVIIYHYRHFFKPHSSFSTIDYVVGKSAQPFYSILEIFYNYGDYGVPMFWSISGFVFAFVYLEKKESTSGKRFFINRFSRLYPLHFATLIIVTLLQTISYNFLGSFQIYELNDLYHFFLNLFFISSWGFEKGISFNGPIWSVSVELVIYFLFFISIINLNKYNIKFALLVYLLLLALDKTGIDGGDASAIALFVDCGKLFFSGVLVFYFYSKVKNKFYLIFISILFIFLSFLGNFKIFLFFPSVLLLFVGFEIFIHDKLKKPFEFFGNLTYAMYLLHIPVQMLIILIFSYLNIFSEIFITGYFFVFYVLMMIILSFLCYKFYEKPLFNKIRSFSS